MFKLLVKKRIPGHRKGVIAEVESITPFWEDQIFAGNALVIHAPAEPAPEPEPTHEPAPKPAKKKGGKAKPKAAKVVEPDPED